MAIRFPMTPAGLEKLRTELRRIKEVERPQNVQDIETALGHGDLRENAEYQAAKEKQAFSMTRLRELRDRVHGAEVVRKDDFPEDIVTLLKRVKIKDLETEEIEEYTILGDGDTDLDEGIISYQSPLASCLIGHKKGEVVEAELPGGTHRFEILEFSFADGI